LKPISVRCMGAGPGERGIADEDHGIGEKTAEKLIDAPAVVAQLEEEYNQPHAGNEAEEAPRPRNEAQRGGTYSKFSGLMFRRSTMSVTPAPELDEDLETRTLAGFQRPHAD